MKMGFNKEKIMSDKTILQIPCTLTDYKSMVNGVRIWFDTQETIPPEILIKVLGLHNQFGWLFFGVQAIEPQQIADLPELPIEKGQKTPSKRLRDRLFVYYKSKNNVISGFEAWYTQEMDRIGNKYLEAIE